MGKTYNSILPRIGPDFQFLAAKWHSIASTNMKLTIFSKALFHLHFHVTILSWRYEWHNHTPSKLQRTNLSVNHRGVFDLAFVSSFQESVGSNLTFGTLVKRAPYIGSNKKMTNFSAYYYLYVGLEEKTAKNKPVLAWEFLTFWDTTQALMAKRALRINSSVIFWV